MFSWQSNNGNLLRANVWRFAWLPCIAIALLLSSCGSAPPASTPKEAADSIVKALHDGDMKALHSLCVGTDAQFDSLQHMIEAAKSFSRFKATVTKKFGDAGKPIVDLIPDLMDDFAKPLRSADFKIDGDHAVMVLAQPAGNNPPKFHKDDGRWKMELTSIASSPADERQGIAIAKTMDSLSDNVEAGKYKDFSDFAQNAQAQMSATMGGR